MAEERDLTPEKQLLKLIENAKGGEGAGAAKLKHRGLGFLSLGSLKGVFFGRFSFLKRTTKKKIKGSAFTIDLKVVNRFLAVSAAALLVYIVADMGYAAVQAAHPPQFAFQEEPAAAAGGADFASPLKDLNFYLDKAASKDLFREVQAQAEVQSETPAAAPAQESIVKSLSLVGISWGANPEIIVEDKKRKKTYFLKKGQVLRDNVRVHAIFKDKVVLKDEKGEYELR